MNEKETEDRIIDTVNKYGWQVSMIDTDGYNPAFAYTIGLTKTFNHPEIIVMGLGISLMHSLLNIAGELVKEGNVLNTTNEYDDFLENYDCRFVKVKPDYYDDFVGYTKWFYKGY